MIKELMLGDWVKPFGSNEGVYAKITSITPNRIDIVTTNGNPHHATADYIKPIPLTPEILEKNGFHINGIKEKMPTIIDDWSDDTYVWSRQETPDEKMMVSVYMDDINNFFVEIICQYCHVDGIHIRYVHELQHTLKLCGIKKTIKL